MPVSLDQFRVWGCDADVVFTVAPGLKLAKLDSKSRLCMFIGYSDEKNAWVFYDPVTAQVIHSRDATFYERQFTVSHATRAEEQGADDGAESVDDEHDWLTRTTFDNETRLMQLISREDAEREAAERAGAGGDSDEDEGVAHRRRTAKSIFERSRAECVIVVFVWRCSHLVLVASRASCQPGCDSRATSQHALQSRHP
jgi:hypothetical protein